MESAMILKVNFFPSMCKDKQEIITSWSRVFGICPQNAILPIEIGNLDRENGGNFGR
jgi:hypothetical protein